MRLSGRWPAQHRTHRMRSSPLLLLMLLHYLLLMHLHLQLLLLLLVKPHQLFLVPVSLHLVRVQIKDFGLLLWFLLQFRFHRLPAIVIVTGLLLLLLLLSGLRRRRVQLLLLILLLRTAPELLILLLSRITTGRIRMIRSYVFAQLISVLVNSTALVTLNWRTSRTGGTDGTGSFRWKVLLMLIRMVPRITSTSTSTTTPTIVLRVFPRR